MISGLIAPVMAAPTNTKLSCNSVIEACDKAIADKNRALELGDLTLTSCKAHSSDLITEVEDLRDSASSWYHNPFVTIGLGILGGIILNQTVLKSGH